MSARIEMTLRGVPDNRRTNLVRKLMGLLVAEGFDVSVNPRWGNSEGRAYADCNSNDEIIIQFEQEDDES